MNAGRLSLHPSPTVLPPRLLLPARQFRWRPRAILSAFCLIVFLLLLAVATIPEVFATGDPTATAPRVRFQAPGLEHPFGTDYLGRDIYTRIVYGARLSLFPALGVVVAAAVLGSAVGLVAGYIGGWADEVAMRFTDVFLAVPALILAMAIATALGPSVVNAALAVVLVWWPGFARLARNETRVVRRAEYVEAARATGAGSSRIVVRHVLPNIAASLIVKTSLDAGTLLLVLSGLSFLGVGAQPPAPEWGLEVATAGQYMFDLPWYLLAPSTAIFLTVFSLNMLGDALRERLDPRLNQI